MNVSVCVQQINAGLPKRQDSIELAPGMPKLHPTQMPWTIDGDDGGQQVVCQMMVGNSQAASRFAEIVVGNSFLDAEAAVFEHFPSIMPIGPLFADGELRKPVGQFWPEDARCLRWLDSQPDRSVVYVAFGSLAMLDRRQFEELALGLELTGRPFLWVVRPDFATGGLSKAWFDEFQDRVAGRGMVVSWCSQQKVCHQWPSKRPFMHTCGSLNSFFSFQLIYRSWRTARWRASCRTAVGTRLWKV
jgi:hypothetical protein